MSGAPDQTRFDELVSRYLDANLGDADEHELLHTLSDEMLAARFHQATQLDVEIAGVLAGSVPDEVMISLVFSDLVPGKTSTPVTRIPPLVNARARRRRTPLLLALAAMLALLLVVSKHYFPHTPAPVVVDAPAKAANATVSSVHGKVYLLRASSRVPLTGDLSLMDGGTIETVGRESRATVALPDGSEIGLKGDTAFTADLASGQRRLFLQYGMLVATVTKQPENAPLIFTTDRAMATVRGTQLAMVEEKSGTYLIVTEGSVALQRPEGGPEVLIGAGFYSHVEVAGAFHSFPISRLPRALREQLPEH